VRPQTTRRATSNRAQPDRLPGAAPPEFERSETYTVHVRADAIVVGAGHNGLVTGALLARAGLRTLILERRPVLGGACVTEELWLGYRISRAAYVAGLLRPAVLRELDLPARGLRLLRRSPSSFSPLPDGRGLLLGPDAALCHESIRRFSERDAARYPEYEAFLDRIARVLEPSLDAAPPDPARPRARDLGLLARLAVAAWRVRDDLPRALALLLGPARTALEGWFESEPLRATLATDAVIGAWASPSAPGTGYVLFHHVMGQTHGERGVWAYVEGGVGRLIDAMADAATERGCRDPPGVSGRGDRRRGRPRPRRHARGRHGARGSRGCELRESPRHPALTRGLRPPLRHGATRPRGPRLPQRQREDQSGPGPAAALPRRRRGTGAGALRHDPRGISRPRRHRGGLRDRASRGSAGAPGRRAHAALRARRQPRARGSPRGLDVRAVRAARARGLALADRACALVDEVAPGFSDSVLHREVLAPPDLERIFGLTGGNIFHGAMSLDRLLFLRPLPGMAHYRTPVRGLYLCGAGTHPGGGVMGACGRNAAREILRDRAGPARRFRSGA
jgi:phytoene dehydrogenase-like protein